MKASNSTLFNSISDPVPPLRWNLDIIPIQHNGQKLLYFHDSLGYTEKNFALDKSVEPLLSLITGLQNIKQIAGTVGGNIDEDQILNFIRLLDKHLLLSSTHFKNTSELLEKKFEGSDIRKPALSGTSYPVDPREFDEFLKELFEFTEIKNTTTPKKALYAPHIDLQIGKNQYYEAFSAIKPLKPKRVVILATAHYTGYYENLYANLPFIGSQKDFEIPGRTFKTDKKFIGQLAGSNQNTGFTLNDRAHRVEHSIEIHLLYLSAIWQHEFEIVPVLVSGFDELFYHQNGELAEQISNFTDLIKELDSDDTFYLISGDLSHVGKKFGDDSPAAALRENVEDFDQQFLKQTIKGKPEELLKLIKSEFDSTRICGFPPLYTFQKIFPGHEGTIINYHWWDEQERESAVSFGSISF